MRTRSTRSFRAAVVPAVPFLWLGIFFLVPILIVLKISFAKLAIAQPPFTPLLVCSDPEITSLWACFFSGKCHENHIHIARVFFKITCHFK